jgi:hypothetical protein
MAKTFSNILQIRNDDVIGASAGGTIQCQRSLGKAIIA